MLETQPSLTSLTRTAPMKPRVTYSTLSCLRMTGEGSLEKIFARREKPAPIALLPLPPSARDEDDERARGSVDVHTLVRRIGNYVCVVEMACNHQRDVPNVVSRVNIGPSVQQKRDCLKAAPPSSPHDRRVLIFSSVSPLRPCPSLEQKGCLGPVFVVARPPQLLVQAFAIPSPGRTTQATSKEEACALSVLGLWQHTSGHHSRPRQLPTGEALERNSSLTR